MSASPEQKVSFEDREIYLAAQGRGGPWAVDMNAETGEPLRVRFDGDVAMGVASFYGADNTEAVLYSGRRGKTAAAALRRAHKQWEKFRAHEAKGGAA